MMEVGLGDQNRYGRDVPVEDSVLAEARAYSTIAELLDGSAGSGLPGSVGV